MFFLQRALCVEPGKNIFSKFSRLKDVQSCVLINVVEFFYDPPGHFCSSHRRRMNPSATSSSARWGFLRTAKALKTPSIYICTTLSSSTEGRLLDPISKQLHTRHSGQSSECFSLEWTSSVGSRARADPNLRTGSEDILKDWRRGSDESCWITCASQSISSHRK